MSLIGGLLGIGASIFGSKSKRQGAQAVAQNAISTRTAATQTLQAVNAYRGVMDRYAKNLRQTTAKQLGNIKGISKMPELEFLAAAGPMSFVDDAVSLSETAFDVMSDQQRSNLSFAIGGAEQGLRQSQLDFSALAAGDTSAFNEIVQASAFGALAENAGMPMGAFANTSARNMLAFRQAGVEQSMGITDFFARQGTVDPVDPIDSVFRLADFERLERTREQQLDEFNQTFEMNRQQFNTNLKLSKVQTRAGVEQNIFGIMADSENRALQARANTYSVLAGTGGANSLASSMTTGGYGQALQQISNMIPSSSSSGSSIFRNPLTGISYGDFRGVA